MSTVPTQRGRSHAGRKRLRSLLLALAAFFAVAGGLVAPADSSVLRGAAVALAAPAAQEEPSELPGDLSRESLLARYAEAVAELNAATTCDAKGNALNRLLAIDRTWLLLGYGEPGLDSLSFYPEVLTFCYEEFFVKCHELQDPAFGSAMLGILRTAHLVVGETLLDASKVDRCLTFELRLEGAFDVRLPGHVWMTHSRSNVPVVSDGLNYTGEAPLESLRFTHTVPAPATVKNTRVEPGVFYVTSMAGDLTYVPGT